MKSKVAFVKVKHEKNGVENAVKRAMKLANWKKHVKGKKLFVKINGISDQLVPGQCTSPWVIDAVLSELRKEFPKTDIKMGDANLAAAEQLNRAAKLWGFYELADKYNVEFVNLSEQPLIKKDLKGLALREVEVPKALLDADTIVNLPVAKTHCLTSITCCLKNHWGMLPRFRHQFHLVANQAIPDVNNFFRKTTLNVVDATVGMEGNAPRTGIPKIFDAVFAGNDRVAIDSAVATLMSFDPRKVEHIANAEKMGIGKIDFEIIGDKKEFKPVKVIVPEPNKQPIFLLEMSFRKTPILRTLIFKTKIFDFFAWGATQYNVLWWYNLHGKKYAKEIIDNTWYGNEFEELWERTGGTGKLGKSTFDFKCD
jgi:uncharacterized protein (DUF362 family)